jgi:voltage-gated potassium channel
MYDNLSAEIQIPIMISKLSFTLLAAAAVVILLGTLVMYSIESKAPNTKMKTFLDALWWCVATVTTVGYGDVVPVTSVGRMVALVYMIFGIAMISILLSVITNTFYRKKIQKDELEEKEREMKYLRDLFLGKISEIEIKQSQILEIVNRLASSGKN